MRELRSCKVGVRACGILAKGVSMVGTSGRETFYSVLNTKVKLWYPIKPMCGGK